MIKFHYTHWLIRAFFFLTAIIGTYNFYSPIPVQDYWDQVINFNINVIENNSLSIWISFHNEHRIVLVRIFYWIIFKFFPSHEYLLSIFNFALITFFCIFNINLLNHKIRDQKIISYLITLAIAITFFWSQKLNFFFEVQSQVLLSIFLPLISFYYFERFFLEEKNKDFFIALILVCFSAITIASGIFASLVGFLFFFSFKNKFKFKKIITLILTILIFLLYLHGYSSQNHSSIFQNLIDHNINIIYFFLALIGNPIHFLLGKGDLVGQIISPIIGLFIFSNFLIKLWSNLKTQNKNDLFLLMSLTYLLITAGLTAVGRVNFGIDEAFSGRYTTLTLSIFLYFLVLNKQTLTYLYNYNYKLFHFIFSFFILLMCIYQLTVFKNNDIKFFDRSIAGLALSMKIYDPVLMDKIYPYHERLKEISLKAMEYELSMFNREKFKTNNLNHRIDLNKFNIQINFESKNNELKIYDNFVFFEYFNNFPEVKELKKITITNESEKIIGFGFVHKKRLAGFYFKNEKPLNIYY